MTEPKISIHQINMLLNQHEFDGYVYAQDGAIVINGADGSELRSGVAASASAATVNLAIGDILTLTSNKGCSLLFAPQVFSMEVPLLCNVDTARYKLRGCGSGWIAASKSRTEFVNAGAGDMLTLSGSASVSETTMLLQPHISDIFWNGNGVSKSAITISNALKVRVTDCCFFNMNHPGIDVRNTYVSEIDRNIFWQCGSSSIYYDRTGSGATDINTAAHIHHNTFEPCNAAGGIYIDVNYGTKSDIYKNYMESILVDGKLYAGFGIAARATSPNCHIVGNEIGIYAGVNAGFLAIYSEGVGNVIQRNVIAGSASKGAGQYGIFVAGNSHLIADNDIYGLLDSGILVSATSYNRIMKNRVHDCVTGYKEAGSSDYNIVIGNEFRSNTNNVVLVGAHNVPIPASIATMNLVAT